MGRKFGHDKQYLKISYRHEPLRLLYQSLENVFILFTSICERTEELFMFTSAKRHGSVKQGTDFYVSFVSICAYSVANKRLNVHQVVNTVLCISFIQIYIRFQLLMFLSLISFSSSGSSGLVGAGGGGGGGRET